MPAIPVPYATIGGARLAIINNRTRDNDASTLYISYANTTQLIKISYGYNMVASLGGMPLSISMYGDPDRDPSASIHQITNFYTLDVIEITQDEDQPMDPSEEGNIPTEPSDRTFTWNGNRLSASKKSERYYINVVDSGHAGNATQEVMLMGVPMAVGVDDELILHRTDYRTRDIDAYETIHLGGSPLTVGRIGNNYYLVVSPILRSNA